MTDDFRVVPLDDELMDDVEDDVTPPVVTPRKSSPKVASSSESRDWDEQGFESNRYDERPPHWEA